MNNPADYEEQSRRTEKPNPYYDNITGLRNWLCELDDRVSGELARLRRTLFIFAFLIMMGAGGLIFFGWFNLRSDFSEQDKELGSRLAAVSDQIETVSEAVKGIKARMEQVNSIQARLTNQMNGLGANFGESDRQMSGLAERLQRLETQNRESALQLAMLTWNFSRATNTLAATVDRVTRLEPTAEQLAQVSNQVANVSASVKELPVMANQINALETQTNAIARLSNKTLQMSGQIAKLQSELKVLYSQFVRLEVEITKVPPAK